MEILGGASVRTEPGDRVQIQDRMKPDYRMGAHGSILGFLTSPNMGLTLALTGITYLDRG